MKKNITQTYYALFVGFLLVLPCAASAQVVLYADGPGNTYELIKSVFAPGVSCDAAV